jgi:hypothetical protein
VIRMVSLAMLAFISQSGAFCIGLLTDIRRFWLQPCFLFRNEAIIVAADYLEYLINIGGSAAPSIIGHREGQNRTRDRLCHGRRQSPRRLARRHLCREPAARPRRVGSQPDHVIVVFRRDNFDGQPFEMPETPLSYIELFVRAAASSSRPHYLLHTRAGIINPEQVAYLRAAGIPIIGGIREGLAAIDPTGALHRARWSRLTEESRRGRSLSL